MKLWNRIGLVVAGLAAMIPLLAACGSASATQSPGKASDVVTWAEPAGATPNWIVPLYIGPTDAILNGQFIPQLYRPLYAFGDGNIDIDESLSLAQLPSWSSNGKTLTITMKNYKWSNGQPVTANDILFDINFYRAQKANTATYTPGQMPDNIVSAEAPNPDTLVLTTDKAYNHHWFLYNQLSQLTPMPTTWDVTGPNHPSSCATDEADCAAVSNYIVSQAKNQSTYASNPLWRVVDGPWRIKSYNSDGHISLVPNRTYSGPIKPSIKQFNMVPFASAASEFNVLKSGKTLDIGYIPTADISSPHPSNLSPLKAGPNPLASEYTMDPWVLFGFNYMPLNFNGPQASIVKELYFRQALQSLVDQKGLIKAASKGYGVPSLGPVPTEPPSNLVSSNEKTNLYPFSITKAKSLLTENGWSVKPGGVTTCTRPGTAAGDCGGGIAAGTPLNFTLYYFTGSLPTSDVVASFKSNASQVGIQISLRSEAGGTLYGNFGAACKPGTRGCDWTLATFGGWSYGPNYYPTGETLFETGAYSNAGNYSSPEADQDIQESILDNTDQGFINYEQWLAKDLPVIYLPDFTYQLTEVGHGLQGVDPQSPTNFIFPEQYHY